MLKERITSARAAYLQAYREWLTGAWLREPDVADRFSELLGGRDDHDLLRPEIRFEMDEPDGRHAAYRQLCVDAIVPAPEGEFAAFICEGEPVGAEQPLTQDYRGVAVTTNQIRWDEVVVRVSQDPTQEPAFVDWVTDWIDLRDRRSPGADGLSGVIHSVIPPVAPRRFVRTRAVDITIDFGSAPADALWDLLDRFVELGEPRVQIGSASTATS